MNGLIFLLQTFFHVDHPPCLENRVEIRAEQSYIDNCSEWTRQNRVSWKTPS